MCWNSNCEASIEDHYRPKSVHSKNLNWPNGPDSELRNDTSIDITETDSTVEKWGKWDNQANRQGDKASKWFFSIIKLKSKIVPLGVLNSVDQIGGKKHRGAIESEIKMYFNIT